MPAPRHTMPAACLEATRGIVLPTVIVLTVLSAASDAIAGVEATGTMATEWSLQAAMDFVHRGLARDPTLVLAVSAAVSVPVLALGAAASRHVYRRWRKPEATVDQEAPETPLTGLAWLQDVEDTAEHLEIGELLRIGRNEDCELALRDVGLADVHAVIQRTQDFEFVIFDVSGSPDGHGSITVNGAPAQRCRLTDGDCIGIGRIQVVFKTGNADTARADAIAA